MLSSKQQLWLHNTSPCLARFRVAQLEAIGRKDIMSPARVVEQRPSPGRDSGHLFLHVFYDTLVMRSAAAIVCDQLLASFCADLHVHTLWSDFQHLADKHYSREAAEVAAQSDVVILATMSHDTLPGTVARWLGSWICQHHKPDAMFCGLFLQQEGDELHLPPVAGLLEATARLIGREWLTGWVRTQVESNVPARRFAPVTCAMTSYFHEPSCHGING